ncbi:hypothetical protein [Vibrio mediterranei]|nr:hypothetical protein [Vibrio mediterranei]MCG9660828.1 hypothetical protein [Vibrio mediterranei]
MPDLSVPELMKSATMIRTQRESGWSVAKIVVRTTLNNKHSIDIVIALN